MSVPFEYRIDFSEHYPKLDLLLFTTVRLDKGTNYYSGNRIYAICEKNERIGFAMLVGKIKQALGLIPLSLIHYDTYDHVTKQDFFEKMHKWYSRKIQWHGQDTTMVIIFLLWVKKLI